MFKVDSYLAYTEFLKSEPQNPKPKILIHACCAPCSTEVLDILNKYFAITIFYDNPNIFPKEEYDKRKEQFKKIPLEFKFIEGKYDPLRYDNAILGFEHLKEGSKRCYCCYSFRLEETAKEAKRLGYDFFTTTLSISPYKNSDWINELGEHFSKVYDIPFFYSNFKKKEGYKKSIQLSKKYNLYRQEYCGCKYSLLESNKVDNDLK